MRLTFASLALVALGFQAASAQYLSITFSPGTPSRFFSVFNEARDLINSMVKTRYNLVLGQSINVDQLCDLPGIGTVPAGTSVSGISLIAGINPIDGPSGILGRAGPCGAFDPSSGLPLFGLMEFDVDDADNLVAGGQFDSVVLHEMLHTIGIGTLWDDFTGGSFFDPRFTGSNAKEGYEDVGGTNPSGPAIENQGGPGTRGGHWRESIFDNELMTGYLNSGVSNPFSIMTAQSLVDLGHDIDFNSPLIESYQIPSGNQGAKAPTINLENDVFIPEKFVKVENIASTKTNLRS